MPSQAERVAWRAANADVVEFLSLPVNVSGSNYLTSVRASLTQYTSLTEAQTAAVRRIMAQVQTPTVDNTATAQTAEMIGNGTYTISDGSEHLTFKIHTVRNGRLAGKRIVKRQDQYMDFKGFAFLRADGTLQVWRSHLEAEVRGERYIVWAEALLSLLREYHSDQGHIPADDFAGGFLDPATGLTQDFTVSVSLRCRACNRSLTDPTSIELGIGPECRGNDASRTTRADAHETITGGMFNVGETPVVRIVGAQDDVILPSYHSGPSGTAVECTGDDCVHCAAARVSGEPVSPSAPVTEPEPISVTGYNVLGDVRVYFTCSDGRDRSMAALWRLDRTMATQAYRLLPHELRLRCCSHCGTLVRSNRGLGPHRTGCRDFMMHQREDARRLGLNPQTPTPRARRTAPAATRVVNPSALGTVIDGAVWDQ